MKPSVHWRPYHYQLQAVELGVSQAAAGFLLDPGLGKTSVTLAIFEVLRAQGYVKRALVIAPLRTTYMVWPKEIEKWEDFKHLKVHVLHGKGKTNVPPADIYVTNPENTVWLSEAGRIKGLGVDMLIVDESTKFKNSASQRFKALRGLLNLFKRRYILTGTPMPNGLMDLFPQIFILDQGHALGRYITHFRNEYFYPAGYGGYEWRPQIDAEERILERIAPLTLRMKAEDYLTMPEWVDDRIWVDLPPAARDVYRKVEQQMVQELDKLGAGMNIANGAVVSGKCRQVANGAVYTEAPDFVEVHDEKANAVADLVESLQGKPLLLLYEFQHDMNMIQKVLGYEVPNLSGASKKNVEKWIDMFNAGVIPVLAGHPASMGHGLNLQGTCSHVCWYGIPWNLEYFDQATRRIYRQGQKSSRVVVHYIAARNTIDEWVMEVLESKDNRQRNFMALLKQYRQNPLAKK